MEITFEPQNANDMQYELTITATLSHWKDISQGLKKAGYSNSRYQLEKAISEITEQADRNFTKEVVRNN